LTSARLDPFFTYGRLRVAVSCNESISRNTSSKLLRFALA
jgi:hypothetical protein